MKCVDGRSSAVFYVIHTEVWSKIIIWTRISSWSCSGIFQAMYPAEMRCGMEGSGLWSFAAEH